MAFIKRKAAVKSAEAPKDYSELEDAGDLLNFAAKNNIRTEPLDISSLAQLLGIKMIFEPMKGDDSGSLKKNKKTDEWVMKVNSLHHPNRQRFTIAHELGHFIKDSANQDEFSDTVFFRNGESNPMEVAANQFAAELLLPEESFRKYVESTSSKVEDIADHFHVSSLAVRIRAKQLGYTGHNV